MGLFSAIFGLPLAPVKGTVWIAERVLEEAEREYFHPAVIRRKLEEVAEAKAAGSVSEEEAAALEQELVNRLIQANQRQRREG